MLTLPVASPAGVAGAPAASERSRSSHAKLRPAVHPREAALHRRAALSLLLPATLAFGATQRATAADGEQQAADESASLPLKAAKLGGILVVADVVTSLVLGRSVLGLLRPKGAEEKPDWKEAAADKLLGTLGSSNGTAKEVPVAVMDTPTSAMAARRAKVEGLLAAVRGQTTPPPGLRFEEVLAVINDCYVFTPTDFSTGVGTSSATSNPAGANEGACRTLAFASLHSLTQDETLCLFAQHATDVLATPAGSSHANIRGFLANGWPGVRFGQQPLAKRRD